MSEGRITIFLEEDGVKTVDFIGEWSDPTQEKLIRKIANDWVATPGRKFVMIVEELK